MSDELKQNENGNFVQFYRDNMQAISKLAGKKSYGFSNLYVYLRAHGRI